MSAEDERERNSPEPSERQDAAMGRAWHDASREQPPSSVDARILAAARASVGAGRTPDAGSPRWWARWQPMLAAAAVAGLAFVLVPMTSSPPPAERATEPTAPSAAQSSGTAPVEYAPPQAPPANGDVTGTRPLLREPAAREKAAESAGSSSGRESAARAEAGAARAPAAVPPPPAAAEGVIDHAAPADTTADRTRESTAAAPTAQMHEQRADQAAVTTDATAWIERVATAYRRGDLATATAELRAFRAVEPSADDLLPDDLREWAQTVE